ncbi:MAG: hypothetical protein IPJ88_08600 [Myxococcales bacterium]|nr:MAG: hypothetical protein IPJ88_08600 [Myxococcales bacterium]
MRHIVPIVLWVCIGLVGCGEPLVGANCADGYTKSGGRCVLNDGNLPGDGSIPNDGGLGDSNTGDAGDGSIGSDSGTDASLPGCPIGQVQCSDGSCVDPNDSNTCGGCIGEGGTVCSGGTPVCENESCNVSCTPPLFNCASSCVDRDSDPKNCGSCGNVCQSGICETGICADVRPGHVVVIGMNYVGYTGTDDQKSAASLVGNAVFLNASFFSSPLKVLAFRGDALTSSITGTDAAINSHPHASSPGWSKTVTDDSAAVVLNLLDYDVFLVYAQGNATNATLFGYSAQWANAMDEFVQSGRVIVVLDGPSATNNGSYQVLGDTPLFLASSRSLITATDNLTTSAPADQLANGLIYNFPALVDTVKYTDVEPASSTSIVVRHININGAAIATHRAIFPSP